MGVVRDVTIEQLTQAVGDIDTSTLAQDSTLQDVVTAIGNISGGNDPVTNTTVNSLCKDTTGQSIASAINALANGIIPAASNVTFDNTGTGLSASNVQAAIAELTQVVEAVIQPMNNKFAQRDAFKAARKGGWISIKSFVNITTVVNASESFAKITIPTIGGSVLAVNSSTRAVYPCTVAPNGSVVSDGSMPTGYYYFYGNIISL